MYTVMKLMVYTMLLRAAMQVYTMLLRAAMQNPAMQNPEMMYWSME